MEQIINYVKPELLIVTFVLYFIGTWLKQTQTIKDNYIPLILGFIGIVFCMTYVLGTSQWNTKQDIVMSVFTAVTQGILVAGLSTYVNQLIKQAGKGE